MHAHADPPQPRWNPLEALAGWALPGLGHFLLGQRRRGLVIGLTIMALWTGGLLIGGIDVISCHVPAQRAPASRLGNLNLWFIGQVLVAPSIIVDRIHVALDRPGRPAPDSRRSPAYEPSFGRVGEQGVLYTTLAGLLNLLAIIDVVYCDPRRRMRLSEDDGALASPAGDAP